MNGGGRDTNYDDDLSIVLVTLVAPLKQLGD